MNFAAVVKKEQSRIPICNKCIRSRIKDDEIEQLQRTVSAKDKEIKKLTSEIKQVNFLSNERKDHLSGLNRSITKKKEEISELKNQAKQKDRTIQNQHSELAKINKAMKLKTEKLTQLNLENEATKRKREEEISELKNEAKEKDRTIRNQQSELAKINKAMKLKSQKLTQLNLEKEVIKSKRKEDQVSLLALFLLYFSSFTYFQSYLECQVCLENCTKSTMIFNCGHYCCSICAESLESCHMCRNKITSKTKLYI